MSEQDSDSAPAGELSAIRSAVQAAGSLWTEQINSQLTSAEVSQKALKDQLDALENDMQRIANALTASSSICTLTVRSITEAHECLQRAKRKLIVVRARVGRLRAFEEASRLSIG